MATKLIKWISKNELYPYYSLEEAKDKIYGHEKDFVITDEFYKQYESNIKEFYKIQTEIEELLHDY